MKRLKVKMRLRIAKSQRTVFEAIVDPDKMSQYFTSSGSARLDASEKVAWHFDDVGAKLVVKPKQITADRVAFTWSASKTETDVVMSLERSGRSATLVKVTESGWPSDANGIARCIEQTRGWAHMLSCMKAYLEYGVHLRKGGTIK